MIPKYIRAGFWDNTRPAANLLKVCRNGTLDKEQINKIAADDVLVEFNIKPKPDHAYIHLITTGAMETYGSNNNGDGYNEKEATLTASEPKPGGPKSITLDGGLKKYHNKTYEKEGGVYIEHNNSKKGYKPSGDVVKALYNDDMHRGEVIVALPVDKWRDDIQKIATGVPVYFSQGSSVPYDICSVCLHKAASHNDRCEHIQFNLMGMDKEGNQAIMINDSPTFHDISKVKSPAEAIACGLRKVAAMNKAGMEIDQYLYQESLKARMTESDLDKYAEGKVKDKLTILKKLAKLEKELPMKANGQIKSMSISFKLPADDKEKVIDKLKGLDLADLFKVFKDEDLMLTPGCFHGILTGNSEKVPKEASFRNALKGVFNRVLADNNLEGFLKDATYSTERASRFPERRLLKAAEEVKKDLSLDEEAVRYRMILYDNFGDKTASESKQTGFNKAADYLAREYAKYQLSFLLNNKSADQKLGTVIAINS